MSDELSWLWRDDCHIRFSRHAGHAFIERGIDRASLRQLLAQAEQIEFYPPSGYPYPNFLRLTWQDDQPLHIVVADDVEHNEVIVVTAYIPEPERWERDWRTRRK